MSLENHENGLSLTTIKSSAVGHCWSCLPNEVLAVVSSFSNVDIFPVIVNSRSIEASVTLQMSETSQDS
jgi:hypothetical protein